MFEFRDQVLRFLGDTFAFLMIVSALFDYRQILCLVTHGNLNSFLRLAPAA